MAYMTYNRDCRKVAIEYWEKGCIKKELCEVLEIYTPRVNNWKKLFGACLKSMLLLFVKKESNQRKTILRDKYIMLNNPFFIDSFSFRKEKEQKK